MNYQGELSHDPVSLSPHPISLASGRVLLLQSSARYYRTMVLQCYSIVPYYSSTTSGQVLLLPQHLWPRWQSDGLCPGRRGFDSLPAVPSRCGRATSALHRLVGWLIKSAGRAVILRPRGGCCCSSRRRGTWSRA